MRAISFVGLLFFACASAGKPLVIKEPINDTEAERLKTYETYRSKELVSETSIQEDGSVVETGRYKALILNNDQKLQEPEALLGVVPAGSKSKTAIDTYQKKRKRERILRGINVVGASAATAGLLVGFSLSESEESLTPAGSAAVISSGLLLAGLTVPLLMRFVATYDKKNARSLAFSSYDESLRARLNLCEEGSLLFDCARTPDLAAEVIASGGDPRQSPVEVCQESRAIGEALSEECERLLRRGLPQKAPDPTEVAMPAPDPTEQEFSLLLSLAEVRLRAEKYSEAQAALQEAKRLKPDESIVEFALGEIERSKGNPAQACVHYRAFLKAPGSSIDNVAKVKAFLAGVDKTANKSCQFNPEKP